ncbi:MAG: gliding motility-associated C-terminal domain-containing protein [Bacteroidetes bacterium]|nr:gliding motility-associated C-terminal domain-containing protein [Bacteroidota bacterium]
MDSTSAVITVTQTPTAIAGLNENICPGTALLLDGSASSGGTVYEWSPAGLFVNNSVAQPLGTFPTSTMVYLEYSNAFCSDIDSVLVNVLTDLELNAWPDTAICIGESIQIHSQYEAEDLPVSVVWLNGDYLSSTLVSNPVSTPLNTITYTVAATCGDLVDYEDVTIVVNSLPTVVANDTMNAYYGQTFSLTSAASGNGPFTYSWTPTEYLACSDCQNTNATPPSDATYFITVVDENNCIAMDSVYLRLGYDCGQYLGLPNLLSPNNDGFNDEFHYQSDAIQVLSYFRVYDRWGRLMFESTDLYGSWDGTYNGTLCDPGVYVYSIQGSCFDGEVFINSGNITLVK